MRVPDVVLRMLCLAIEADRGLPNVDDLSLFCRAIPDDGLRIDTRSIDEVLLMSVRVE